MRLRSDAARSCRRRRDRSRDESAETSPENFTCSCRGCFASRRSCICSLLCFQSTSAHYFRSNTDFNCRRAISKSFSYHGAFTLTGSLAVTISLTVSKAFAKRNLNRAYALQPRSRLDQWTRNRNAPGRQTRNPPDQRWQDRCGRGLAHARRCLVPSQRNGHSPEAKPGQINRHKVSTDDTDKIRIFIRLIRGCIAPSRLA